MSLYTIVILALIGVVAGILSGFVGIGGGILIVPALVFLLGLTQHQAQGTSLALMLPPIGIMAVYNYYKADSVNWKYALVIAVCFVLGGYLGSKLSLALSPQKVKRIFGVFMLLVALKMIFSK
ncbi:sulfite exporter TauE/SafE family protein [Luteibaculum oceani]|uniref:Probable membrane transporter protein n=1 Tax=Luteibaculum oceani TaxID=1294296 RepID=A0A5C6V9G2_9FLAO|nr:sulfite exporter TauE/SafE family protein [Luteibaculum oceani]TXC81787.1 sulfite exporter TauE/SafE family protein [Luteibaculum oceani]